MSGIELSAIEAGTVQAAPAADAAPRRAGRGRRLAFGVIGYVLAVVAVQSPFLAVLLLGAVMWCTRRFVFYLWWRESPLAPQGVAFALALAANKPAREKLKILRLLWRVPGVQALFNIWLATLPACALWAFAWYDGWNNSFHKGYEQAAVGPLLGLTGFACFIGVMLYAPIAQARQAATGSWKAFWDFRLVRELARARWLACFALALGYALAGLPILVLRTVPMFFEQISPSVREMSTAEAYEFVSRYYFWSAFYVVGAFLVLRLFAGWIYASALRSLVQTGRLDLAQLHPRERSALEYFQLATATPPRRANRLVRVLTWPLGKAARIAFLAGTLFLWFAFAAQIFVAQFFNHLPVLGFLQHPLVQLPWFRYLPAALGG